MVVTGFILLPLCFTPNPASGAKKGGPLPDREQQVRAMVGLIPSHEQAHWSTHCWRGPTCRQPGGCYRNCTVIQVSKDFLNDRRAVNAGNDLEETGAFAANTGLLEVQLMAVISTGQRNTLVKSFSWCFEV